ncbi:hypothetical protein G5V57_06760 [Nordella sp. HKS 07]|uniref:hypothetical protein n=1 Tax=Nordella sp. HKS 07 TaxID=2712222 RepID=UPI0013E12E28|nr:hypothetical protein [Nordella sp. HKS 07]QIG47456.1 hypothetical protein G5V57_06760 [Nordella sp. HKS 07]
MVTKLTSWLVSLSLATFLWGVTSLPAHAANQYLVISAKPASDVYPVGKVLGINDEIVIPSGTIVTLLGEDGSVNRIHGPDHLIVTEEKIDVNQEVLKNRSIFERVTDLLFGSKPNSDSLGVTRSVGGENGVIGPMDPWSISIHESGPACVLRDRVVLSRLQDLSEMPLAISADNGMKRNDLVWAKNVSVFEVPLPLAEQASELTVHAGSTVRHAQLNRLPADIDLNNVMDVLAWMLDKNCRVQAAIFARNLGE